jgi:hypothetical protein
MAYEERPRPRIESRSQFSPKFLNLTSLQLILSRDSGKRPAKTQEDEDVRLLAQIQEASPTAAQNFLEYLIFQKRSVVGILILYYQNAYHKREYRIPRYICSLPPFASNNYANAWLMNPSINCGEQRVGISQ